jgi:hypothetical protein
VAVAKRCLEFRIVPHFNAPQGNRISPCSGSVSAGSRETSLSKWTSLPGVGIGLEFAGLEPATRKLFEREVERSTAFPKKG